MGKTRLVVCTPCFGMMLTQTYVMSLLKLMESCRGRGVHFSVLFNGGDAMITRSRAKLLADFLNLTDGTHLLFIDADIGFEPTQAFRLLDRDVDFAAASYPLKYVNWQKAERALASRKAGAESAALDYVIGYVDDGRAVIESGFARVKYAGTGFMMLKRGAIVRLCEAHPELRYRATHSVHISATASDATLPVAPSHFALFDPMIDAESGTYLSEDYSFCRRWIELGGHIWMDMQSKLDHVGQYIFKGDLSTQLEVAAGQPVTQNRR